MMKKNRFFWPTFAVMLFTASSCIGPAQNPSHSFMEPRHHPLASNEIRTGYRESAATQETQDEPGTGKLDLSIEDAVFMSLSNNISLEVERLNTPIVATYEEQEEAVFDPVIEGSVATGGAKERRIAGTGDLTGDLTSDFQEGWLSLKKIFPSGTGLAVELSADQSGSDLYREDFAESRLGLIVTRPLMRGYGKDVNLAKLRQSRLEKKITDYELRGFAENLVSEVEQAYWGYALALRKIEIVEESLKVAEQQLAETKEMILVGAMAEAEMAAVQAEVAEQKQQIIDAKSAKEKAKLQLLQLLAPPGPGHLDREIQPIHPPSLPEVTIRDIDEHLEAAMKMRPEMNQARLKMEQGEIEIVRTKNGMLPLMDLFIVLGKTGYADSFTRSLNEITGDGYDLGLGINVQYPLFNRRAAAGYRRAELELEQAQRSIDNLARLIQVDVRKAHIEVERTREQIAASSATREFQEEKLRIETEKFRVGRSTNFMVAQAQRDLLVSRINEVEAVVDYLKALVDFYRLEGSLLERRGIEAPGMESPSNL